jgi:hypothetical protein
MKSQFKVSVLIFALLISGSAAASADFSDEFAPSKWTYTETDATQYGPTNSLSASTMSITSANYSTWVTTAGSTVVTTLASPAVQDQAGVYSIVVPHGTGLVTFDYSFYTADVSNSSFDMATYTVNGVETNLVPTNVAPLGTSAGSVSLNFTGLAGTTFSINQKCSDCVLGAATTRITNFNVRQFSNLNVLSPDSGPAVTSDANGYICTPGSYSLLSRGVNKVVGKPTSLAYTLIVDGVRVSSVSSDNWGLISQSSVAASNNSVTGSATLTSATWAYKGANLKSARCEVVALQDGVTSLSGSK